jgi:hypothetical protein
MRFAQGNVFFNHYVLQHTPGFTST